MPTTSPAGPRLQRRYRRHPPIHLRDRRTRPGDPRPVDWTSKASGEVQWFVRAHLESAGGADSRGQDHLKEHRSSQVLAIARRFAVTDRRGLAFALGLNRIAISDLRSGQESAQRGPPAVPTRRGQAVRSDTRRRCSRTELRIEAQGRPGTAYAEPGPPQAVVRHLSVRSRRGPDPRPSIRSLEDHVIVWQRE